MGALPGWTPGSGAGEGIALGPPVADAAVHRKDVGVAHLLQVVGGQGRAKTATAVSTSSAPVSGKRRSMLRSMTPLPRWKRNCPAAIFVASTHIVLSGSCRRGGSMANALHLRASTCREMRVWRLRGEPSDQIVSDLAVPSCHLRRLRKRGVLLAPWVPVLAATPKPAAWRRVANLAAKRRAWEVVERPTYNTPSSSSVTS